MHVGFVLLTFTSKCSMPTFTFCISFYFNPKINSYLLFNSLSKLAKRAVSKDKLQKTYRLLADYHALHG